MAGDITLVVNTIGLVLFLGTIAGVFAEKYKIPKMIPLIITGIILSFIRPEILIDFSDENIKTTSLIIAELGLLLVLYQEGMHLSLRQLKENILPISILAVVGTVFTATLVGLTISQLVPLLITDLDISYLFLGSLLMASVVVPTDPAATFSILRSSGQPVKNHLETILGGESAFNDVIAIMLVIVILLPQVEAGNTSLVLTPVFFLIALWQLIGGILLGIGIAAISLFFIGRVNRDRENAAISLSSVFAIFSLGPVLNVSAAIAALAAGVILANPHYIKMKRKYTDAYMTPFWDKVVFLIEIFAFTTIGFLFSPGNFIRFLPIGLVLSAIVITIRLVAVYLTTGPLDFSPKTRNILSLRDRFFIAFAGFKGLTTAVLAILSYVSLSAVEGVQPKDLRFANVLLYGSLIMILISGTVQGLLLPIISDKMEVFVTDEDEL